MFFNQFWGAAPGGVYGFGSLPSLGQQLAQLFASLPRMSNWMGSRWMDYSANRVGPGWWGQSPSYGTGWPHRCEHHHCSQTPASAPACATPAPAPVPAAPVLAPDNRLPTTPLVKKEGDWDPATGGYVLGASGEVDAKIKSSDRRSSLEYRTSGSEWIHILRGKDDEGKTATIKGQPGATVEFRVGNNQSGEFFKLGTTSNVDNKDHAKVQRTGLGVRIGVDEWANDDGDFDDFVFELTDKKAKG